MKTLVLLLLMCSSAFAQSASEAWHSPWGFQGPQEKFFYLEQATRMKFVEDGGLTNKSYFTQSTTNAIGNLIQIQGDGNIVDANNSGNVAAQTNEGSGNIKQKTEDNNSGYPGVAE